MDQSVCTVIIRGSHKECDKNITCCREWTVEQLKRKIECVFPGNPETCKQRLIYAGKLLHNDHQIKNILKENNEVVHLAYYQNETSTEKDSKPSCSKTIPEKETLPQQPELRQRTQNDRQATQSAENIQYQQWAYSQAAMNSSYMSHIAYMQWMQYQQYAQYYGYPGYPNHQQPTEVSERPPVTDAPPAAAENQPAPANENIRMDAQAGGRPDDEDELNRDWLDAAFGFVRLCMMLSIVYFYSSTYRFLITVGVFIGIYLYQAGAFQVNRRPRAQQPNDANEQQQTDDNNNQSDGAISDESVSGDAPPATPPPPGVLITAWHFVRSFFSSLVPTGPPGVAN